MNRPKRLLFKTGFQWIAFPVASLLIFLPVIHNSFLSDDYRVMRRVGIDHVIFVKDFFRPLSDITLYGNYLAGGFNPLGYYLANIIIHGVNAFLLVRFCANWKWSENKDLQQQCALAAGILFLVYPFHNETIVWILGRASLLANGLGILGLLAVVSRLRLAVKIACVCSCYFIGLTSYESVFLLPLMVLAVLYSPSVTLFSYVRWMIAMGITLLAHIILRISISGGVLGSYGQSFFSGRLLPYLANLFKVTARMFVPPINNPIVFSVLAGLLLIMLFFIALGFLARVRDQKEQRLYFAKNILLIAISCVIPVLFGVSTRTSESDRFLYFPSFFVCALLAFLLFKLFAQPVRTVILAVWIIYFLVFLEVNNQNWVQASSTARNILDTIKNQDGGRNKFIINLPEEINGAYIFRVGLEDALVMEGVDTAKVHTVNLLSGHEAAMWSGQEIEPVGPDNAVRIPPGTTIERSGRDFLISNSNISVKADSASVILYWNTRRLVKWQ